MSEDNLLSLYGSVKDRQYRAKITEQMGNEVTLYDPKNSEAWIHSDFIVTFNE